ncbi:Pls/PosA family non-ribosomal peptide synthetase [Streptomyces sp. NPDC094448]|uniref:Pls/PosA family non-ribosomal peptide synthetase n=1 Tax=Streptomyces sp. NPDC094448 TaxID=3366063 RepID=UPI00380C0D6E
MTVAPEPSLLTGPAAGPRAVYSGGPAAPERTLLDILAATARAHPGALALDDGAGPPLTYRALLDEVEAVRRHLAARGVARGARVGVRVPSGTADLYVCVLGVLAAGAAYVPVDADDPEERARTVFREAAVAGVLGPGRALASTGGRGPGRPDPPIPPRPGDDAWVIFTSGSTGRPKGVAVTHRAAAAFVDAEARLFLRGAPLGPGDRVLAGLSVAFDASCEEMWLAWRHGACLVPAPRALVRTGADLGPWLAERGITAVSTVPTLAELWPQAALDGVRLLVLGGEACPAELAGRLAVPGREVWNTYGPTEATVVSCAARLTDGRGPVKIGLPLAGWDLAVVDRRGEPVAPGESGELVIGGAGLARYLDPARDTAAYAPLPATGWPRAYRSGDLVRADPGGLVFLGRADDQIKIGGRRIELGEIDAALRSLPDVTAAAAAVRTTPAGTRVLVGYVVPSDPVVPVVPATPAGPADPAGPAGLGAPGALGAPGTSGAPAAPAAPAVSAAPATPGMSGASAGVRGRRASGDLYGPAARGASGEVPYGLGRPSDCAGSAEAPPADGPAHDARPVPDLPGRSGATGRKTAAPAPPAPGAPGRTGSPGPGTPAVGLGGAPDPGTPAARLGGAPDPVAPPAEAPGFDVAAAVARLRQVLPAGLVPVLAVLAELPTRTSGKVDRDALPWPLPPGAGPEPPGPGLTPTEAWLAAQWGELLGAAPHDTAADFFAHGGGSLAAARLVSRIRERYGTGSVGDIYRNPGLGALARFLDQPADGRRRDERPGPRTVPPVPHRARTVQLAVLPLLLTLGGLRWAVVAAAAANIIGAGPGFSWWWIVPGWLLLAGPPGRIVIAAGGARLLLRGLRPGSYPRGGSVHLRLWAAERLAQLCGAGQLAGCWLVYYARALGVRVGDGVDLHSLPPVTGLLRLGRGAAVEPEADLAGHWLDGDRLHIGAVRIGAGAVVGARSTLFPGTRIGKRAEIAPGSAVTGTVPAGERWSGVPAIRTGRARTRRSAGPRPPRRARWTAVYALTSVLLGLLPAAAALPALLVLRYAPGPAVGIVPATLTGLAAYALLILAGVRALGAGLRAGSHPVHGPAAWRAWAVERLMDTARAQLFPLYASLATPGWLRALGMKVGRGVEASTVLALPGMTTVGDGAFLADDTMIGSYELGGGRLRIAAARVGKRAFLGNSGMTAAGRRVPKRGLVGVLSAAPKRAEAGSSWLGMPPMRLPRTPEAGDRSRTYAPPARLRWARAAVELCRIVPVLCSAALAVAGVFAFAALAGAYGILAAAVLTGPLLAVGGVLAWVVTAVAKWLLAGRFRAGEHPLWSGFVWRGELADTFVEVLAVPWLIGAAGGTPLMNLWLRTLGARVGRGAWCETYWLPEADLVSVGAGASVNRGCVLQTHLFHDRIMRLGPVELGPGATLGPHAIALPGSVVGAGAVVGPASLVLRGERVPPGTRWLGNPIAAWPDRARRAGGAEAGGRDRAGKPGARPDEDGRRAGSARAGGGP